MHGQMCSRKLLGSVKSCGHEGAARASCLHSRDIKLLELWPERITTAEDEHQSRGGLLGTTIASSYPSPSPIALRALPFTPLTMPCFAFSDIFDWQRSLC